MSSVDVSPASTVAAAAGRERGFHLGRFLRNAAIVAAVIGACVGLWFGVLRDRIVAKRLGPVTATIYRSGQLSEYVVGPVLSSRGIQHILDLNQLDEDDPGRVKEYEVAKELNVAISNFPLIGDGTGDVGVYTDAVAALIEADRTGVITLVHCSAGTQRTGGVVAAFRMLYQGWTPEAALDEARQYDWKDEDRPMAQYLAEHLPEIRKRLIDRGALAPSAPNPVMPPQFAPPRGS
ncbi:MAG: dual specificity protein phosphatase family protein [Phycisphaerae bacterium]|nr:dual specificity protein phosphatase family protein [Phycisphaerae bacterium]